MFQMNRYIGFRENCHRFREGMTMQIAWLLPRKLVYWCAIRVGASATVGEHSGQIVPDLRFMEAIERWK